MFLLDGFLLKELNQIKVIKSSSQPPFIVFGKGSLSEGQVCEGWYLSPGCWLEAALFLPLPNAHFLY